MIYKLAVLLLLCTIGCSRQAAESEPYAKKLPAASPPLGSELHENAEDGFSIYLPAGWGAISDEALAAQGAAVSGPEVTIEYLAGYQILSNDLFVHPFVLVRKLPNTAMPREKIKAAQQLMLQSGDEIAQRVEQNSGLQLNMELGVPVLDRRHDQGPRARGLARSRTGAEDNQASLEVRVCGRRGTGGGGRAKDKNANGRSGVTVGHELYYETSERHIGSMSLRRWDEVHKLLPLLVDYLNRAMRDEWEPGTARGVRIMHDGSVAPAVPPPDEAVPDTIPFDLGQMLSTQFVDQN